MDFLSLQYLSILWSNARPGVSLLPRLRQGPTCDMFHGMEPSFTLTRGVIYSQTALQYPHKSPVSPCCGLVSNQALVLISQQMYVEIPMIRSVLRASWGQILGGTQADTEEGDWRPLAGVEDCVQKREMKDEEDEEDSPPSFSSDTSDIAGSLGLKERKEKDMKW